MSIRKKLRESLLKLNEDSSYDKLRQLELWYKEEKDKLEPIKKHKEWKFKLDALTRLYFKKKNEIEKANSDPYELKGNMDTKYIYHYTDSNALINIIDDNIMIGSDDGISFTSNANLYKRGFVFWYGNQYTKGRNSENTGVKLKFDFNKLKADGFKFRKGSEFIGTHSGENEIRLLNDEIYNPLNYITDIFIFKDKEENYMKLIDYLKNKNIRFTLI